MRTMQHWIGLVVAAIVLSLASSDSTASNALIQRRTEDTASTFEWDLSSFSIRFRKCQIVKMFDDYAASDSSSDTVFTMKHFILYNLCPADECGSCNGVHGEYVVGLEDYLEEAVKLQKQQFEYMCANCNERCNDNGQYCDGCGKLCYQYDNLEANGYVDASTYMECQKFKANDDGTYIYIGPYCSSGGSKILIGLFTDQYCWQPYTDTTAEEMLGMKLSYHLLANEHSNNGSVCLSCKEINDNNNNNKRDNEDADNVNEMCENVYDSSAKCESPYGLDDGFVQTNKKDHNYENQVENEFMVCNFINSLAWNSYTATGEINTVDEQDEVIRVATPLQIASLSVLLVSIGSLVGYARHIHKTIEKSIPKAELSRQGDHELT